jgi:hypothetical protein
VHSLNEDPTVPPRTTDTTPWLDVQVSEAGTHAVTGELDMGNAPILREYSAKVVAERIDETPIVVDLSDVPFTVIVGLGPLDGSSTAVGPCESSPDSFRLSRSASRGFFGCWSRTRLLNVRCRAAAPRRAGHRRP